MCYNPLNSDKHKSKFSAKKTQETQNLGFVVKAMEQDCKNYLIGRTVDGLLCGCGGMHRGHQTLQDTKVVVDDLNKN